MHSPNYATARRLSLYLCPSVRLFFDILYNSVKSTKLVFEILLPPASAIIWILRTRLPIYSIAFRPLWYSVAIDECSMTSGHIYGGNCWLFIYFLSHNITELSNKSVYSDLPKTSTLHTATTLQAYSQRLHRTIYSALVADSEFCGW